MAGGAGKPHPDLTSHWNVYFAVEDAQTAVDAAVANAGSMLREPRKTDRVGVIARLSGLFGATFTVIELDLEID